MIAHPFQKILVLVSLAAVIQISRVQAEDPPEAKKAPETIVVTEKPLRVEVELDGVAVAKRGAEVAVSAKQWSSFVVLDAAPHGAHVKKGEILIRFKTRKLDQAIEDAKTALTLTDMAIKQSEREIPLIARSLELQRESAETAERISREDTERFLKVEHPLSVKQAEFSLKSSQHYYEYALEELRQLEKMYEADDLTEESEEMILKRQRHQAEQAKFSLERAKIRYETTMKFSIPRAEQAAKRNREAARTSFEKTMIGLDNALKKKKLELEKQKRDRARSRDDLKKLLADRKLLVVRSPATGTVYYGKSTDGHWNQIADMKGRLVEGGTVEPNKTVMTVIRPGAYAVHTTFDEKLLADLRLGQPAAVTFPALGKARIQGEIEELSDVPVAQGKFAARVSLAKKGRPDRLVAGMACKIRPLVYDNPRAITVPLAAVDRSGSDPNRGHIVLVTDEGTHKRTRVILGHEKDGEIEVVRGLRVDDKILAKVTDSKKKDKS